MKIRLLNIVTIFNLLFSLLLCVIVFINPNTTLAYSLMIMLLITALTIVYWIHTYFNFLNSRSINRLCLHEAGHTMFYAGYSPLPEGLCTLFHQKENGLLHGFATANLDRYISKEEKPKREQVELHMLMLLGGKMAERQFFSKIPNFSGFTDDMQKWNAMANTFTANHKSKILNNINLIYIQYKQEQMIKIFFQKNKSILKEIARLLEEKQVLFDNDLKPLLKKIDYPDNFPVVNLKNIE